MSNITDFSSDRATKLPVWSRNRDFTSGSDAVKGAGTKYLPRYAPMTDEDYRVHTAETEFFAAAAKTLASHIGLVYRKEPVTTAPKAMLGMLVTSDGKSIEQLAKDALREFEITNDGALLVDYPYVEGGLTQSDALKRKLQPTINLYCAENIRKLRHGVIDGRKVVVEAVLMDDENSARKLELIDGVYTVTLLSLIDGNWIVTNTLTPRINKAPIGHIPLYSLNDGDCGAPFDDLCALNATHYAHCGRLNSTLVWASKPQPILYGLKDDVELDTSPGSIWRLESPESRAEYLSFSGDSVPAMERNLDRIEQHMTVMGSRMLAADKAAAEAEATIARRTASENSILASHARHVSAVVQAAWKFAAEWQGLNVDEVTFMLSTDFVPTPLDPATIQILYVLRQNNEITRDEFLNAMVAGELIPEVADKVARENELEGERETIDRPIIE